MAARDHDLPSIAAELSPTITGMIRLDHSHVLALFRRFKPSTSLARKKALVANACLALEIHAQLEEEIFYPALRKVIAQEPVLKKSVLEHDEMREMIQLLRVLEPGSEAHDSTFRSLIRTVLHHVADEETVLLPQAEVLLRDQLRVLGARMTKRRMQLLAPHASEVFSTTVRSFPVASFALATAAVGLALGLYLIGRRSDARPLPRARRVTDRSRAA